MKLMDEVAGIVAARHCHTNVVTVAVDAINFHRKIKKGERSVYVVFTGRSCRVEPKTPAEGRNLLHHSLFREVTLKRSAVFNICPLLPSFQAPS